MFSQTAEYAIRALIELAKLPEGETMLARDLASTSGVPTHYLSKILQSLARVGVLESFKGIKGGFRLATPASEVSMHMVVQHLDNLRKLDQCMLGQAVCEDDRGCPMHGFWKEQRGRYIEMLHTTSMQDLAEFQVEWERKTAAAGSES